MTTRDRFLKSGKLLYRYYVSLVSEVSFELELVFCLQRIPLNLSERKSESWSKQAMRAVKKKVEPVQLQAVTMTMNSPTW